jgi:hypothetical protein
VRSVDGPRNGRGEIPLVGFADLRRRRGGGDVECCVCGLVSGDCGGGGADAQ